MLKQREDFLRQLSKLLDASVIVFSFIITFIFRQQVSIFYKANLIPGSRIIQDISNLSIGDYFSFIIIGTLIWCATLHFNGMYRTLRTSSLVEISWIIIKSAMVASVSLSVVVFLLKLQFVSRLLFLIFILNTTCMIVLEKTLIYKIIRHFRRLGYNYRQMLIVGIGKRVSAFIEKANTHPEWGFKIKGIIDDEGKHTGVKIGGVQVIGSLNDLPKLTKLLSIDEVIFILPRSRLNIINDAILSCEIIGVKTTIALDLFDFKIAKSRQTELDGMPFITFETAPSREWELFIKKVLDLTVSSFGIIILSPILLLTALLIKLTSKGPVFFLQKRVGLNGKKFVMYKFRTMEKDAYKKQRALSKLNMMQGPAFKVKDDPRTTLLGKFLRKFSIDELPQLFNVFLGEMSIVGPRPPTQKEVLKYESWQRRRLSMRPGITCFWQISGRNNVISFDEWMKLDLNYIDNWSLRLDFIIFFKTIPIVLFGRGAY